MSQTTGPTEDGYVIHSFTRSQWKAIPPLSTGGWSLPQPVSILSKSIPPTVQVPVPKDAKQMSDEEIKTLPEDVIRQMVHISRLAYWDEQRISSSPRIQRDLLSHMEEGFPIVIGSRNKHRPSAQMWLSKHSKTMVVVYRGAGTVGESLMEHESKCQIHSGFLTEFNMIEPILRQLLQGHHEKFKNLVFTGHGIGGALATISAPHFASMCPQMKISCVTFGSPRVGDKSFCVWFNSVTNIELKLRLIIEDDPLTMFPSTAPYQHVQDAVCLRHDGRFEYWPDTVEGTRWDMPFSSLVMYIVSVFVHLQWEYDDRFTHAFDDIQRRKGA